jgi:two-component system, chemotaxis family, protein-glutamate methylesterase/glutaminase
MHPKRVVVVGASAGGLEVLRELVSGLPPDLPAPICIVLHTSPQSPGVLDSILSRAGRLKAVNARDRERLQAGRIYVAPPDCHLLIEPGMVRVTKGPRENRFRPAIDPLFRSAAQVFGPAAIGVVLSGNLDDGTAGLWAIKQLGGTAIVQDPDDTLYPSMPRSAIDHVRVDHVVPVSGLASLLVRMTSETPVETANIAAPEGLEVEVKIAKEEPPLDAGLERIAEPSIYACPECHGVLLQLKEGERPRFRCHTGHAYSIESLLASLSEGVEESLWNAIRALEEADLFLRGMAEHVESSHDGANAARLIERAKEARRHSDAVRKLAMEREPLVGKG